MSLGWRGRRDPGLAGLSSDEPDSKDGCGGLSRRTRWLYYYGMVDLQSRSSTGQRSTGVDTIAIDKRLISFLLQLPARQVWMDYDAEGDVLYLSFAMPQQATDSVMGEDGNVYHYRGERLVGVTILHASKHAQVTGE